MTKQEQDLVYFRTGIQELEDYLLSEELYWTLASNRQSAALSRLTLGGLLMALVRLSCLPGTPHDMFLFQDLQDQLAVIREKRRSVWEQKVTREIGARLDLWRNYLEDYQQFPEKHYDAYQQEVRWRVMLQLLEREISSPFPEEAILQALDEMLHTFLVPGKFIWESVLSKVFERQEYWFLYGNLRAFLDLKGDIHDRST